MKTIIITLLILSASQLIWAQDQWKPTEISIAYFGNFLIQPGGKIGINFNLKNVGPVDAEKPRTLFLNPQIAFYSYPGNNISILLNTDVGIRKINTQKNAFSSLSVGLGYLRQYQITSIVYNLSDGSVKEKKREQSSYFLPSINYAFGKRINSSISWFSKYSLGAKFSSPFERTLIFFLEAGLKINL